MISIGYCRSILLAIVASFSTISFSSGMETMKKANALFDRRGEDLDAVHRAKSLYYKIIKDKRESNKLRRCALDRYARLVVFEGEVAQERFDVKDPAKLFRECIEVTEYLNPKNMGEMTPEYTYWRAMCIGLWAASASKVEITTHLGRLSELKSLNTYGMEHFREFDGFGFNRILAGMHLRSKALAVLNLYNPDESLKLINESLEEGCDSYMTYILKAEALDALSQRATAIETLEKAIVELKGKMSRDAIPWHLTAENQIFLMKMYELLEGLS